MIPMRPTERSPAITRNRLMDAASTIALLFFLFSLHLVPLVTAAGSPLPLDEHIYDQLPSNSNHGIVLKAAILAAAPPLAVRDETTGEFSGFQIDLIERIQQFAAIDGINLTIELEERYGYTQLLNSIMTDCNTTSNPVPLEECYRYDILIGDYYTNEDRAMKVDFTPPWLQTSVSALKKSTVSSTSSSSTTTTETTAAAFEDVTTLEEADRARATICALVDGFLDVMARTKYPNANFLECGPSMDECIQQLKDGNCALFLNDEIKLRHLAVLDPTLEVTRERSNSQFITWPMRSNLQPIVLKLMKRWIYAAKSSATLDELFDTYFAASLCPIGKAGPNCDQPCDPSHGRSDRMGRCLCDSTRWIGDDCSIEVLENTNSISEPLLAVGYLMVSLNVVAVLVCAGWLWIHRSSAQVQVVQPFFLCLVLLGCVISTSTIVVFAQDSETEVIEGGGGGGENFFNINTSCMAIPWLYSVGFSITFGTLFAKIRGVYKMFRSAVQLQPISVSIKETILIIGAILVVDFTILGVWTLIDPLRWERTVVTQDKFGDPLSSEGMCVSDHWMLFATLIGCLHFCLLGLACYHCYLARTIPTKFSEGKYVSIAIVSNLQIFVVAVPVLVVLGSDPQSSFFVRSAVVWMNDFVVVSLIFGPLMFSVWKDQKENINGVESIRSAMEKFTSRNMKSSWKSDRSQSTLGGAAQNKACLSAASSNLESIIEFIGEELNETGRDAEVGTGSRDIQSLEEGVISGKKLMEDLMAKHQNQREDLKADISSADCHCPDKKKTGSLTSEKLSFTSFLGAMSSLTLSEIDEDMPFDSALRYSECSYSRKGEVVPDKPPLFPRRRSGSDDSSQEEEENCSSSARQDGPPSAPIRADSEGKLDFSEGTHGTRCLPEPIAEESEDDDCTLDSDCSPSACYSKAKVTTKDTSSPPLPRPPTGGCSKPFSFRTRSDVTDNSPNMPLRWESDLETPETMVERRPVQS